MINSTKKKVVDMLHKALYSFFASASLFIRSFTFFFLISTASTYASMPMSGFSGGFPDLSPEELQALEKEFEQAAQVIDQYVSSLSPEEQAEFYKEVERVEQMMSSMSEEELGQFFEEVLAQELANSGQGEMPRSTPTQTLQPKTEPLPDVKPKITSTEQEAALALLDSIIQHTDEFLIKTNNIPDLSIRVKRWITQQKIQSSAPNATWESIKATIEAFRQKLHRLKDINPKTNQYRFITLLTKNTSLYGLLTTLSSNLTANEPLITVSSFGIEVLNSQSKHAIIAVLNAYNAAITSAITEIDAIFGEYAPEAQKLKEEEAKLTEQASAEAAKPRTPKAPRVGGSREEESAGRYGAGGGYPDYGYGDYYGQGYQPSYGGSEKRTGKSKEPKTTKAATGGGGQHAPHYGYPAAAPKKDKKKKDKKTGEMPLAPLTTPTGKQSLTELTPKGKQAIGPDGLPLPGREPRVICPLPGTDGTLQLIKSNLEQITELLKETTKITALEAELTSPASPDMQLALVTLPGLERRAKRLDDLIKQYLTAHNNSDEIKQQLRDLLDGSALFKDVAPQLQSIKAALGKEDDAFLQKISAPKQYAYLAMQPNLKEDMDTKALDEIKKAVPHPTSLTAVANVLENIHKQLFIAPKEAEAPLTQEDAEKNPAAETESSEIIQEAEEPYEMFEDFEPFRPINPSSE